jgi:hypothetical protein
MKQLVYLHTRGDQTLDLIVTNLNKLYDKNSLSSFPPFGLSDHNVLLLNPKERRGCFHLGIGKKFFGNATQGKFGNKNWDGTLTPEIGAYSTILSHAMGKNNYLRT